MELSERVSFMVFGMAIGFVLGYIVARLREIKEEVDEIDTIVKETQGTRNESGFMRFPVIADLAYLLALLLILSGLWLSYQQREELEKSTACNTEYLKSQAQFLSVLLAEPPASEEVEREALREYYDLLTAYSNADERPSPEALAQYNISDKFKACLEHDANLGE